MSPARPTYASINRRGWNLLCRSGCDSSQVVGPAALSHAQQLLDSNGWLPWDQLRTILCLAGGGGQQAPMFAALGYEVTVADNSPAQLALDRQAATRYGVLIESVLCDAMDCTPLAGRSFDLVYQPVSTLYLPDVRLCYQQIAQLLEPGGLYWSEHWNPVEMQLDETLAWDGTAYRLSRPQGIGPVPAPAGSRPENAVCWHYIHRLNDLLGGLCSTGFSIVAFAERPGADLSAPPGTRAHLGDFIPGFFAVLARKEMR